jgi:L-alanine-DL-glutamate epimerase-like enolase superfamily enzyme
VKVTDIKAHVLKPTEQKFQWREGWAPQPIRSMFVRVLTDAGHEGQCITWLLSPEEFEATLPELKAATIGRDVHDVEAISDALTNRLQRPSASSSIVDICLWDALGKHHGEPIYKLLGAARDRILAYASTTAYTTDQEWIDVALQCQAEGFRAYKIHPYGVPDKDIRLCKALREAVGDSMALMIDAGNAYDLKEAHRVAKVLVELNFYRFEAPISDADVEGLEELTRTYAVDISAVEFVTTGFRSYGPYVTGRAVNSVRSIGDVIGGITAMRKSAALCEAFDINYDPHSYGTTHVQAAHLHIMLAIHHCDYAELPVPQGIFDHGMQDGIRIDPEGYIQAPAKPGLGYEADINAVDGLTIRQF